MKLDITRDILMDKLADMSADEIITYFEGFGLELTTTFPAPLSGIYRRELGTDLVYTDGTGYWSRFDKQNSHITWACVQKNDWWVRVLDNANTPVFNGLRILMDGEGNRVG